MTDLREFRGWMNGSVLVLATAALAACGSDDTGPQVATGSGGYAATGGTPTGTGADTSTGGAPGGAGGALGGAGGAVGVSTGGSSGGAVGPLDPPPPPPTSDVPPPSGAAATPNLRVLPWAGFVSATTYTFDDTQPSQIDHWPELEATGVNMTFFANPPGNWYAGYDATWTAVAAAGSEIGNHTMYHCRADLTGCGNDVAPLATPDAEIDEATSYIIANFGVDAVYSFAAPYGDVGWNAYAQPRFLLGRGVGSGVVAASGTSDWYNLPVFAAVGGETAAVFNAAIDDARAQGAWGIFVFHSILPTTNNWFAGVDITSITASLEYATALGDVWVDSMVHIGAYARAQQVLEAATATGTAWTWTLPDHFPPGQVLRVTVDGGTLSQLGTPLVWDSHGYYQVALDAAELTWAP